MIEEERVKGKEKEKRREERLNRTEGKRLREERMKGKGRGIWRN